MWTWLFSCHAALPEGFEAPEPPVLEHLPVPALPTAEPGHAEFVVPRDVDVAFELREDRSLLVKLSAPAGTCRAHGPLRLAVQTHDLSTTVDVAGFGLQPRPPPELGCLQTILNAEAELELPSVPVGEWVTLQVRAGGGTRDWAFWGGERVIEVLPLQGVDQAAHRLLVPSDQLGVLWVGGRIDREKDGPEALEAFARARQWRPIGRAGMRVVVELPERDVPMLPEPNRATSLGELRPGVTVSLGPVGDYAIVTSLSR
jgi:hypothetical protein